MNKQHYYQFRVDLNDPKLPKIKLLKTLNEFQALEQIVREQAAKQSNFFNDDEAGNYSCTVPVLNDDSQN